METKPISTAATDATNKVNSIQIGVRNLVRGTSKPYFNQSLWAAAGWSGIPPIWNDTENAIEFTAVSGWQASSIALTQPAANNEDIIISFKAKQKEGYDVVPVFLGVNNSAAWTTTATFTPTSEWVYYKFTFKATGARLNITIRGVDSSNKTYKILIQDLMFEKGNKASTYSDAPEDVQGAITTAQSAAEAAQTTATDAKKNADTANNLLTDIANDNKLTPNEKSSVRQEWNIIAAELSVNNTQADIFGITTEKTAYNSAFQALANYLNNGTTWSTGVPSWISDTNLSVTTTIVGNTFRANWKAYYDARTILLNAIAKKSKQLADAAQSSADTANAGLLNKVAYSEYNAQMQIQNDKIASKVSQNDFNALGQRVGTTESQITQQAGQISSVVTQVNTAQTTADGKTTIHYQDAQPTSPKVGDIWQMQTYTNINGVVEVDTTKNVCRIEKRWNGTAWILINVNASGSYVTQTNDSITSIVTKTGINSLGTGETLKSLIDQTPSQIQLAVSAIQIGARNLVRGTSKPYFNQSLWSAAGWSGIPPIWNDTENAIEFTAVSGWQASSIALTQPAANNEDIIISFKAKQKEGYDVVPVFLGVNNSAAWTTTVTFTPTSEWVYYKFTFKATGARLNITIRGVDSSNKTYKILIQDLMFEKGNKASAYSDAPEDVQGAITTAQSAAEAAQTTATDAKKNADTANNLLTDIANDNKLDPAEKQNTKKEWDAIVSEYSKNITQANSFSVSTTAYTSAYNALSSYVTPLLNNLNKTSDIVGTTFRSTFKAYYDARTDLLNAVSTKAKTIADSKTDLDTVKAGITINTDGITAFGNQFKVDSTLIANAIQTQELNVGNGNCIIGTDGKIKGKGAEIEGKLRLLWNGSSSGEADTITVVDASQSPEKTKVLITPMNIRSINDIAGNQYNVQVIAGGAAASDSTTDSQKTWTSQSFTLASGKKYDLVIPAITLIGETNVEYDRTTSSSMYRMYLDNTTTGSSLLIAYGYTSKTNLNAQWNSAYVASGRQEGTYRLRIVIEASSDAFGNSAASYSVPAGAIIVVRPITDAIEIGGNGMMGAFTNERYFHISTNGMYFRMGDKGFRITTSGVQVSDNMQMQSPTWRTL